MCGIAGWIDYTRTLTDEIDVLKAMTDKLANRGPDASDFWFSNNAALGHRRLVVVDPNGGKQPMIAKRGQQTYCIVYNGELYNTEDIRELLISKGYSFEGWSDTEVLLKAYMEWGEECVQKLNGIFAFAVWNEQKQSLFLARDRIGVKPLFYCKIGSSFLFGSEIKALLAHPEVTTRVDREGLAEIFALGPARSPGHGVFFDISELKPGYCMYIDRDRIAIKKYWSLISKPHEENFDKTVDSVRELVYDSIKRQLVSDVPLCTLLSGGLDSSIIATIASQEYKKTGGAPVNSFSIDYLGNSEHFKASEFQPNADAPWIEKISAYLGTRHASFITDTPELINNLYPAVISRDLPGMADIDASLLLFSQWIKKNATVGLSGECADEVFGGYPWFYKTSEKDTFPWSQKLDERLRLFSPELISIIKPKEYVSKCYQEAIGEVPRFDKDTLIDKRMRELFYLNLTRWMPTLLDRKDRMSMAAGLELRVPFCDHRLVEYVWNVPWEMKNHKGREKGLLRQAFTGLIPEDVLWRKKSPYPKTHNPNFLEAIRLLTLSMLENKASPILHFINKQTVRELALSVKSDTNIPWFGQLMNAPQLLAYLLQIDFWLKEYKVNII